MSIPAGGGRPAKTLVIMAAGIGSRYGGIKQIEPVGPSGELIIDYSVFDALRAGFTRVIFIITRAIEADFRAAVGDRLDGRADTEYAFQAMDDLPPGFALPEGRVKPWGTVHAVMAARDILCGSFAVINADDFYGPAAFERMSAWLGGAGSEAPSPMRHAMVAYKLGNTLSEHGAVTRGVCLTDGGRLRGVKECRGIERAEGGAIYPSEDGGWIDLPPDMPVSMNFWGLDARFIEHAVRKFPSFLQGNLEANPLKCEYLLPDEIDAELSSGEATVDMLESGDVWHGVTYREDRAGAAAAAARLHEAGVYPSPLWG